MNKLIITLLVLLLAGCDQSPQNDDSAPSPARAPTQETNTSAAPTTSSDGRYGVGDHLQARSEARPAEAKPADEAVKTLEWDDLIPKDYDPMVLLEGVDLDNLEDGDPRAQELLDEVKAAWDDAPAVEALDGKRVRLPGFGVPLEGDEEVVTELLLVPYFGACIHVPPPPSNQIVHVFPKSPVPQDTVYDAMWVEGILHVAKSNTKSGRSSYRLDATEVKPYE